MSLHSQCLLRNDDGRTQTSWIPKEHAEPGHYVRLKENGVWTDHWFVVNVFSDQDSKDVMENSDNYRTHRKATDI